MQITKERIEKIADKILVHLHLQNLVDGRSEKGKQIKKDIIEIIKVECDMTNAYEIKIQFETTKPINDYFKEVLLKNLAERLGNVLQKQQQNFKQVISRELTPIPKE